MPNCYKCTAKFPNNLLVQGKVRNLSSRKFCLDCSPFGRHNTKDLANTQNEMEKFCNKCKTVKPITDFYKRRKGSQPSSYCKPCTSVQTLSRQRALKQKCVDYKGGSCELCGYSKYAGAFDFHHIDPTQKDFTIAHQHCTSFNDKIKAELDKCLLLCATCHREEHGRLAGTF